MNHQKVIENFAKGKNYKSGNVFADCNTLYSYGRHFPLAIRRDGIDNKMDGKEWVLLNGDKYSVSTNRHQNLTYRVFRDSPRVAFSAIRAAGMYPESCRLIDFYRDAYEGININYSDFDQIKFDHFKENMPVGAEYHEEKDKDGNIIEKSYHRIGAVVLEQAGKYYLCGMDEGSYFVSLLPEKVKSVSEGYRALKPDIIRKMEKTETEILRQGEWFFVAVPKPENWKQAEKSAALPSTDSSSNRHVCTRLLTVGKKHYASGCIRHQNSRGGRGDHRMLKLGDGKRVYQAVCNTAMGNWSAGGRVD